MAIATTSMAPNYTKTIICLANSRKIAGRCIAGKEIAEGRVGGWIRPVSARPNGEISEEERRYENGTDPAVLDVVTIALMEPRPHSFQVENHLIDGGFYWTRERVASPREIEAALDVVHGPLWDESSSSYNGLHDRIEEVQAEKVRSSLKLVKVTDLKVSVGVEGAEFPKRKVRGQFSVNGVQYRLAITDPVVERRYLAGNNGLHNVGDANLCLSLGEPYQGYTYNI